MGGDRKVVGLREGVGGGKMPLKLSAQVFRERQTGDLEEHRSGHVTLCYLQAPQPATGDRGGGLAKKNKQEQGEPPEVPPDLQTGADAEPSTDASGGTRRDAIIRKQRWLCSPPWKQCVSTETDRQTGRRTPP